MYVYANNDCGGFIYEFLKMYSLSWKHCIHTHWDHSSITHSTCTSHNWKECCISHTKTSSQRIDFYHFTLSGPKLWFHQNFIFH